MFTRKSIFYGRTSTKMRVPFFLTLLDLIGFYNMETHILCYIVCANYHCKCYLTRSNVYFLF